MSLSGASVSNVQVMAGMGVHPITLRSTQYAQFRRVSFPNPFPIHAAQLGILYLPPPHSCAKPTGAQGHAAGN